ncbi:hypothetical protein ACFSO0_14025 [Brevibacillus sp. GCM10020057]|uniref:hypothetical protein n=1 Tax=Brevibacillus sp. GCM10020057 TaxID=3317327 RepID=UPI00362825F4
MNDRYGKMVVMFLLALVLLSACSSAGFDPENEKEYGVSGIYLGQNVQEAIDVLKPTRADFMDMVSRQSYTVEQMAQGAGDAVMGILQVGRTQIVVKVRRGKLQSIMLSGVPQEDAAKFKTARGLAMYDSAEQVHKLYGRGTGKQEIVYQGSRCKASFGLEGSKVAWMKFESL